MSSLLKRELAKLYQIVIGRGFMAQVKTDLDRGYTINGIQFMVQHAESKNSFVEEAERMFLLRYVLVKIIMTAWITHTLKVGSISS